MSIKSGKDKVWLCGGPMHGYTVKLSPNGQDYRGYRTTSTFVFSVKGEIGNYIGGRWKPYDSPDVLNSNIVLSEN
jgi:hypothetical protein